MWIYYGGKPLKVAFLFSLFALPVVANLNHKPGT